MAQQVKLLEAFSEFTIRGFSRFVGQMQRVKRLASVALAPFRMLGRVIRMAFSPLGLMLGGAGLLLTTRALLKLASTAEETQAKFEKVFKEESAAAEKFVQSVAKATGRYTVELRGYMASLQDTFVPLGFARAEARKMSEGLTRLAMDVASFNPEAASTEQVLGEMKSAMVGNIEAVRKYGIVISEVTMKEVMLKMGYKGTYAAASEQLKTLARLKIMYEGTKDAQGDLIDTGDSFKNLTASMWAQLKRLGDGIGTVLIPAFKALGELVSALSEVFSETAEGRLTAFKETIKTIADYVSDLAKKVKAVDFGDWWGAITTAVVGLKDIMVEMAMTVGAIILEFAERAVHMLKVAWNEISPNIPIIGEPKKKGLRKVDGKWESYIPGPGGSRPPGPIGDAIAMHLEHLTSQITELTGAIGAGMPGAGGDAGGQNRTVQFWKSTVDPFERQQQNITDMFKEIADAMPKAVAKMKEVAEARLHPNTAWIGAAGLQQRVQEQIDASYQREMKTRAKVAEEDRKKIIKHTDETRQELINLGHMFVMR